MVNLVLADVNCGFCFVVFCTIKLIDRKSVV